MAGQCVDLKLNKDLLDPHFDGYKLSLESLPTYKVRLESGLDVCSLTDEQYSYQHVKAFATHNHIFLDPWNQDTLFFVDDRWKVMKCIVTQETSTDSPLSTFQIANAVTSKAVVGRHNVTLSFPASDWLVLADGAGQLDLIHTGNRKCDENWKVCHSVDILPDKKPFTVLHSVHHTDADKLWIECVLLHVEETQEADGNASTFQTLLEWLTFSAGLSDVASWSLDRSRTLTGSRCPDYVVIGADGRTINVASEKPFKFIFDSVNPVVELETKPSQQDEETRARSVPAYTWSQTTDDCTLQFTLPPETTKADIIYHITPTHMELSVKNGKTLLDGHLHARVDTGVCTWMLHADHKLELFLEKAEVGSWPEVIQGDTRGELVPDPEEAARIHERLAHLTSEKWNPDPDIDKPAYNPQQLEECDIYPEETFAMLRFDGDSHVISDQVNLGANQWLFNSAAGGLQPPGICLRHDVDGILWQPLLTFNSDNTREAPWEHVATFKAFGYVQASKQQKKYIVCAQDYSYVALCDCVRHVYVYRQSTPTLTPLRNRKTGRQVDHVSKQQLISVESTESIMGVCATNDRLYIIAGKILYVVRVSTPQE